jgi:hypothetical protein
LDLNATNEANNGNLGLALPRVELTSTTGFAPLQAHVAGMMVYNTKTTGDVTPGTYYNTGSEWVRIGSGSSIQEGDGVIGVIAATPGGGLTRAGSGTAEAPYTLGIEDGGVTTARILDENVTTAKIAAGAVTAAKLNKMDAASGEVLKYNGSAWTPAADAGLTAEVDGIVGNEVTNATTSGGLARAGSGTAANPYTLGIAAKGVTSAMLGDNAVTARTLGPMGASINQYLSYNGTSWVPSTLNASATGGCLKSVQLVSGAISGGSVVLSHAAVDVNKSFVILNWGSGDASIRIVARNTISIQIASNSTGTVGLSAQIVEFY